MTGKDTPYILCAGTGSPAYDVFSHGRWATAWSDVVDASIADYVASDAPCLCVAPGNTIPNVNDDRFILCITELDHLESVRACSGSWQSVVFEPSALAILDELKARRETLVIVDDLSSGMVILDRHIGSRPGGSGVDASLKSRFVGLCLQYDVAKGSDLTFGHVGDGDADQAST